MDLEQHMCIPCLRVGAPPQLATQSQAKEEAELGQGGHVAPSQVELEHNPIPKQAQPALLA